MLNISKKPYTPHPISIMDYQKMAETGILSSDVRVELIEGEIIDMAPIGSTHASYVNRLNREIVRAVNNTALVSVQNPIILGHLSEPEPDFALLKPKANDYVDSLPNAADILLLIEIADTTIKYDRQIKAPLYARFSIPEYWLISTQERNISVFQKPIEGEYTTVKTQPLPTNISPLLLPDIKLEL
ncbi:MAG: Uma2 family endonuclease [Methylococcales bacterium]